MMRRHIPFASRNEAHASYKDILQHAKQSGPQAVMATIAALGKHDLFFLLTYLLHRKDVDNDFCFARCKDVAASTDGHLDLWARGHYKSTIITFALTIQDILNNPEITIGIFSHSRPAAAGFLQQIKQELEKNKSLKDLYPDILYAEPQKESPCWSLKDGICVRRSSNPKEKTVEAWGVVEGQPIGKHFQMMIYDDIVTAETVNTPEQIAKTSYNLRLSYELSTKGGGIRRMIGTRYHMFDTYSELLKEGSVKPRIHAATVDGTADGEPVFLSREELQKKRAEAGPYVFACQLLLNPVAEQAQGFKTEWLHWWKNDVSMRNGMNVYILVDPAGEKKKTNDYTTMWVVGLGSDGHTYIIDGVRDRINLTERTTKLFALAREYSPLCVGYEKYGMQADIEHIKHQQYEQNYHFPIVELGGAMPKNDRIRRMIPNFEAGKVHFPMALPFKDASGAHRELVKEFVEEEFSAFPVCKHDDMLDCLARIKDEKLGAFYPHALHVSYGQGHGGLYDIGSSYNPDYCAGTDFDPLAAYK